MTARSSGRPRSLWSGLALSAATVVVCLLAGEFITRIGDPSASLWHWPYYAVVASQPSPGPANFGPSVDGLTFFTSFRIS